MPKRQYILPLILYLAIPAVMFAGAGLFRLFDPEKMARGHANYVRDYHLWELFGRGLLMATAGLMLCVWIWCCYAMLKSKHRSLRWLFLLALGPFGFIVIATLADHSPSPDDLYAQFIRNLTIYWRVLLEIVVFISVWVIAYQFVVLLRDLMISYESFTTGTPTATIIARQEESSGMYAFGEGLQEIYLVMLIYLLRPILFNFAGQLFRVRSNAMKAQS
jgi:hypothetical protein